MVTKDRRGKLAFRFGPASATVASGRSPRDEKVPLPPGAFGGEGARERTNADAAERYRLR